MENNNDNEELIQNPGNEENLISENKSCSKNKIMIFSCVIAIFALSVIGIIIVLNISREPKNEKENENKDNDSPYELDTIPSEEMEKARRSFKQYQYINNSKIIDYNFYSPENITENELYPLIVFISDKSLLGQEVTAPLNKTVGGPIWATDTVQKKHKCYVLVPQYNETISTMEPKSEYVNVTISLIKDIQEQYQIDKNRIYGTGQSMGAMVLLYLLSNHPDLYTAGLIVDGHWNINELHGLVNATFTYFAAEGDPNPYNGQNELKAYFDENNVTYCNMSNVNAQEKVEILNQEAEKIYEKGNKRNFITYANGTVLTPGSDVKGEHMASFKYGYRIETVRDWLFDQSKYLNE